MTIDAARARTITSSHRSARQRCLLDTIEAAVTGAANDGHGEIDIVVFADAVVREWLMGELAKAGFDADYECDMDSYDSLKCWFHVSWNGETTKE